jgi:hypothetical protein
VSQRRRSCWSTIARRTKQPNRQHATPFSALGARNTSTSLTSTPLDRVGAGPSHGTCLESRAIKQAPIEEGRDDTETTTHLSAQDAPDRVGFASVALLGASAGLGGVAFGFVGGEGANGGGGTPYPGSGIGGRFGGGEDLGGSGVGGHGSAINEQTVNDVTYGNGQLGLALDGTPAHDECIIG